MKKTILALLLATSAFAQKPATLPWDATDLGSFHSGCFKFKIAAADQVTAKGIAIKAGPEATVLFDSELLRVTAGWTGGFITFPRGRGGLEGTIKPAGELAFTNAQVPGWAVGEIGEDPRPDHQGNVPGLKWRGLYTNGEAVVLSYEALGAKVLEVPGHDAAKKIFTRTLTVSGLTKGGTLLVAEVAGGTGSVGADGTASVEMTGGTALHAGLIGAPNGARLVVNAGRIAAKLPAMAGSATFTVALSTAAKGADLLRTGNLPQPAALAKGGPARWGAPLVTQGKLSEKDDAYVIDDIPLPDDNPFKSWLRPGGHDFFPDGRIALVNISGDVWIVGGIDEKLEKVTWKRFATGLFQPLGCKVVDGKIYVLGRDQITRLHDLNNDGEADYYENFNNDCVVTDNYHEFALDLQTDSKGNFYYAKGSPWEPTVTSPHQGCMIRVSKDGAKFEIVATGLRAPNGLGMGPQDQLSCSDNQGHWMPANRLNLIKPGGFYGMTPAAHRELTFTRADGTTFKANPSTKVAREEFKTRFWGSAKEPMPDKMDLPLLWMPQNVDNSPGGEVWVPAGDKWGPLAGQMLHLSYGKCILYLVMQEQVGDLTQGAVVRLAGKFPSGIMRGRFSPKDGQLYVSGLNVWQSDAAKFGCLSRVRFTGKMPTVPKAIASTKAGITLTFTAPLDTAAATDPQNWSVERWNYQWTGAYGSKDISVADSTKTGKDLVLPDAITISADKKSVSLAIPGMVPVNQMKLTYRIKTADGQDLSNEIHHTIHRLAD
jgi:hypothetical protein